MLSDDDMNALRKRPADDEERLDDLVREIRTIVAELPDGQSEILALLNRLIDRPAD